MVYTVTMNPSLDYYAELKEWQRGQINRTEKETFKLGGKGFNVSSVLSELGVENIALWFRAGFTGEEIDKKLELEKFGTVAFDAIGQNRINLKIKETGANSECEICETDLNGQGCSIDEQGIRACIDYLKRANEADSVVLSGGVGQNVPEDIYARIINEVGNGVRFFVDASGAVLSNCMSSRPFLIKCNVEELSQSVGRHLEMPDSICAAARGLQDQGARNVFITASERGGWFLSEKMELFYTPAPSGTVVNTTGAGDSALAGFIANFENTRDCKISFIMGICAGSASAFGNRLADKERIESLYRIMINNQ